MNKIVNIMLRITLIATVNFTNARTINPTVSPTAEKRQIKQNTKALEQKLEQVKKAPTPVAKQNAQEDAYQAAQALILELNEERTLLKDIYSGYSPAQIKKARITLAKLYPMQKKINDIITKKEDALSKVSTKTLWWSSPLSGKEKEYDTLSLEITKLKDALSKIDRAIRNQNVIAGEEWSNAYRALVSGGFIGTAAIGIDFILTGGTGTLLVATKGATLAKTIGGGALAAGNWLKDQGTLAWDWAKWSAQYGIKGATVLYGLYKTYTYYYGIYKTAEEVYNMAMATFDQQNPNATPENRSVALMNEKQKLDAAHNNYLQAKKAYENKLTQLQTQ